MNKAAAPQDSLRLDVWLWAARFYKTRSLCAAAIDKGRVKLGAGLDTATIKPARSVKIGDIYTIEAAQIFVIEITALSGQRRDASFAKTLYTETAASQTARLENAERWRLAPEPESFRQGKPSKQDRKAMVKLGR